MWWARPSRATAPGCTGGRGCGGGTGGGGGAGCARHARPTRKRSCAAVTAVESDRRAVAAARRNLAADAVSVVGERVDRWLRAERAADVVVLDPPRKGAGRDVVTRIAAAGPRSIVYVACDPSALARD